MSKFILKASGEREPFSRDKFLSSLKKAGVPFQKSKEIYEEIESRDDLNTTSQIYKYAFDSLKNFQKSMAAHYTMKRAVMELGPEGYPFERFVAEVFKSLGYETETGQLVNGFCINHEIDVIARSEKKVIFMECKFHNHPGTKSDVKVAMYIRSRYEDIVRKFKSLKKNKNLKTEMFIVTNTKFTSDAIRYGDCYNLKMLGWQQPNKDGLAELINRAGIHPITSLTELTTIQKRELIKNDIVLCKQLIESPLILKKIGISELQEIKILSEAKEVITLKTKS